MKTVEEILEYLSEEIGRYSDSVEAIERSSMGEDQEQYAKRVPLAKCHALQDFRDYITQEYSDAEKRV